MPVVPVKPIVVVEADFPDDPLAISYASLMTSLAPYSWYRLKDASSAMGATMADSAASPQNGTYDGTGTVTLATSSAITGEAAAKQARMQPAADGTRLFGYGPIGSFNGGSLSGGFTMSVWVWLEAASTVENRIFYCYDGSGGIPTAYLTHGSTIISLVDPTATSPYGGYGGFNTPVGSVAALRWDHIVLTWTPTGSETVGDWRIYINGVLSEHSPWPSSVTSNVDHYGNRWEWGSWAAANMFQGYFAEPASWTRPLDAGEILRLFLTAPIKQPPYPLTNWTRLRKVRGLAYGRGRGVEQELSQPAPGGGSATVDDEGRRYEPGYGVTNLISNPSLEVNATGWANIATYGTSSRDTAQKYSGAASLKLVPPSGAPSQAIVSIEGDLGALRLGMIPGRDYTFSAYVRVPSGLSITLANCYLRIDDGVGGSYQVTYSNKPTAFDTWQRLTVTRTIRGEADSAFIRVVLNEAGTSKYLNVDAAMLEEGIVANTYIEGAQGGQLVNVILNPSFEVDMTGWTTAGGTYTSTPTRVTTDYKYGVASGKVSVIAIGSPTDQHDYSLWNADSPTPEQGAITYSVWVKGPAGRSVYARIIRSVGGTAQYAGGVTADVTTTAVANGDWQRLTATITAWAGAGQTTGVQVRAGLRTTGAQVSDILLADGAQIEVGAAATDFVDGSFGRWEGTANASRSYRGGQYYPNVVPLRAIRSRAVLPPGQLVADGGFELQASGAGTAWPVVGNSGAGIATSYDASVFAQGAISRKVITGTTPTTSYHWQQSDRIYVDPTLPYVLAAKFRKSTLTPPPKFYLRLRCYDAADTLLGTVYPNEAVAGTLVNLVTNPSCEVNTTGWGPNGVTLTSDAAFAYVGTKSLKVVSTTTGYWATSTQPSISGATAGRVYTAQARVYVPVGSAIIGQTLNVTLREGGGASGTSQTTGSKVAVSGWQSFQVTRTIVQNDRTYLEIIFDTNGPRAVGDTIYIDAVQVELASTASAYIDGDQADGRWSGTAHASTSYRNGLTAPGSWPAFDIDVATTFREIGGRYRGQTGTDLGSAGGFMPNTHHVRVEIWWHYQPTSAVTSWVDKVQFVQGEGPIADAAYNNNGDSFDLFNSYVERWPVTWGRRQARVEIPFYDALATAAPWALYGSRIQELTSARINGILDRIGWPAAARSIGTGLQTMVAVTWAGENALDELAAAADTELGTIFVDQRGYFVFHNRDYRTVNSRSLTAQATFANDGVSFPYVSLGVAEPDLQKVVNDTTVSSLEGEGHAFNAFSQGKYASRKLARTTRLSTLVAANTQAARVVNRLKDPMLRYPSLVVEPARDVTGSLWRYVLGAQIADRVIVSHQPAAGGSAVVRACYVEAVAHATADGGRWSTTFTLSPVI